MPQDLFKTLSKKQKEQLQVYKQALLKINLKINLFSRKETGFLDKLIEENLSSSLLLKEPLEKQKGTLRVLDIGSGAGLPGLICAVLYPHLHVVLCERNRKKSECLKDFIFQMNLQNASVFCGEADKIQEKFPLIFSQATGNLEELLKIAKTLLQNQGDMYLWKNFLEEETFIKSSFHAEIFIKYPSQFHKNRLIVRARLKSS